MPAQERPERQRPGERMPGPCIHCGSGVFAVDRRLPVINFGLADSRTRGLADSRTRGLADSRTRGLADSRTRGLADSRTRGLADSRTRGLADSASQVGMRIVVARMPVPRIIPPHMPASYMPAPHIGTMGGAASCLESRSPAHFPESSPPRRPLRFRTFENAWHEDASPHRISHHHTRPDDGAPGPTRAGRLLQTGRIPSQHTPPGRIPHERIRPVRRQARNRDERAVRTGWARTRANVPAHGRGHNGVRNTRPRRAPVAIAMNGPCAAANALTQLTQGTHGLSATHALSADRPVRTLRPVPDFKGMNNQHIQHGRHSHGQTDRYEKG